MIMIAFRAFAVSTVVAQNCIFVTIERHKIRLRASSSTCARSWVFLSLLGRPSWAWLACCCAAASSKSLLRTVTRVVLGLPLNGFLRWSKQRHIAYLAGVSSVIRSTWLNIFQRAPLILLCSRLCQIRPSLWNAAYAGCLRLRISSLSPRRVSFFFVLRQASFSRVAPRVSVVSSVLLRFSTRYHFARKIGPILALTSSMTSHDLKNTQLNNKAV